MCQFHQTSFKGQFSSDPAAVDNVRNRIDPSCLEAEQLPNSIVIDFRNSTKAHLRERGTDIVALRNSVARHLISVVEPWWNHLATEHGYGRTEAVVGPTRTKEMQVLCGELRLVSRIHSELRERENRPPNRLVLVGRSIDRQIARDDLRCITRAVFALSLVAEASFYPQAKSELTSLMATLQQS